MYTIQCSHVVQHYSVVVFVDSVLLRGHEKKGMATFYLIKRYRKKQVFSEGRGGGLLLRLW